MNESSTRPRRRLPARPLVLGPMAAGVVIVLVTAVLAVTQGKAQLGPAVAGAASASRATAATAAAAASGSPGPPSAAVTPGRTPTRTVTVGPEARPPFPAAPGRTWVLSFDEEFNGTDYDHTKLTPCFDWNEGECTSTFNHGREHYDPAQVTVSNGTAKLTAAPARTPISSSACQGGQCTYVAGLLSTARRTSDPGQPYLYAFTYGFVEARIKFPATRGFFTAFWMLPADPTYQYRSELDILELLGDDPTTMFMTYHYDHRTQSFPVNAGKGDNGKCPVKDYSTGFVDVGVDWEPHRIAWYINGVQCGAFTDAAEIENGPMQLLLHMMVDNDWQRSWNVGLTDPVTRSLVVDYIRVYQQRPA